MRSARCSREGFPVPRSRRDAAISAARSRSKGASIPTDNSKPFNLEIATNTAITADLLRIEGSLTPKEAQFRLQMLGATATLSPDSFDNFIAKILPKDGLRVDFDAGVGFGVKRGRFFEGTIRSAGTGSTPKPTTPPTPGVQPPPLPPLPPETGPGFGLTIPIGKSLGPFTIHNLQLRFGSEDVDGKTTYLIQAASSISTKLGPVMARVDRAGLKFGVRIPDREQGRPGNLGFADVDVGAVLPNGVSLAIDVKGVRQRRRLPVPRQGPAGLRRRHAAVDARRASRVKAFGLIATKMPDGSKGYSMIVFITAEDFQPIPIGMGCDVARHRRHGRDQPHVRRRGDAGRACATRRSARCCSRKTRSAMRRRSFAT